MLIKKLDAVIGHLDMYIATSKVYQDYHDICKSVNVFTKVYASDNHGSLFRASDEVRLSLFLDLLIQLDSRVSINHKMIIHNGCLTHANIIARR